MIKINAVVIVEGKYDKIKLENIIDALILTTDGFRIFKDKEKISMLKAIADKKPIVIMTDSDSAGKLIRNFLKQKLVTDNVINVYLPQILGKEKRKEKASAEGFLGVEGSPDRIIIDALSRFNVCFENHVKKAKATLKKQDLYFYGLSGKENSLTKRKALLRKLELPENLSANSLIDVLNTLYTDSQIKEILEEFCTE
ncbi:MAG: DUF4093 domain-containing protein [Clostridia bacterium]|nr:DUF4093 domain-containing protein [Clostridia bacterium]